jgi:hypothetical protein
MNPDDEGLDYWQRKDARRQMGRELGIFGLWIVAITLATWAAYALIEWLF